MQFRAVSGLG